MAPSTAERDRAHQTGTPPDGLTRPEPERDRGMMRISRWMLAIAAVLAVVGAIIALIADGGLSSGIGATFLMFATIPATVGIALIGYSLIARRSRAGKPFA